MAKILNERRKENRDHAKKILGISDRASLNEQNHNNGNSYTHSINSQSNNQEQSVLKSNSNFVITFRKLISITN